MSVLGGSCDRHGDNSVPKGRCFAADDHFKKYNNNAGGKTGDSA